MQIMVLAHCASSFANFLIRQPAIRRLEPQPISLRLVDGCESFSEYQYTIVGGPDDGRRIRVLPPRTAEQMAYGQRIFNGSRQTFEREFGISIRPSFGLHAAFVRPLAPITIQSVGDLLAASHDGLRYGLLPSTLSGKARAALMRMPSHIVASHMCLPTDDADVLRDLILEGLRPCPAHVAAIAEG